MADKECATCKRPIEPGPIWLVLDEKNEVFYQCGECRFPQVELFRVGEMKTRTQPPG